MGALEAAGSAATAAERALAAIAVGAMRRMAARPLRVALAAALGLCRASFVASLVATGAIAGPLDRRSGSRRACMAMAAVAASSAKPATAVTAALFALGRRQLERF